MTTTPLAYPRPCPTSGVHDAPVPSPHVPFPSVADLHPVDATLSLPKHHPCSPTLASHVHLVRTRGAKLSPPNPLLQDLRPLQEPIHPRARP